jgi:phosphoribosylformylglycinamidine synthase
MTKALVIRAAGTNCDAELCRAFALAGAAPELVHLDRLIAEPMRVDDAAILAFPGGFSFGDDIASGRIFAMRLRERLWPALRSAVARGCPVIGVCNGFQVLVQVGLLPGPRRGGSWPEASPPAQSVALTDNSAARFEDRWVPVRFEPESVCVWTHGLAGLPPGAGLLPVAHGEGRLVLSSPAMLNELEAGGQVAVRYGDNYNGSDGAIAGLCDATGLVFGLMPHPERYLEWTRHPWWTRLERSTRSGETPGLRIFRNAVEAARGGVRPRPARLEPVGGRG